MTASDVKIPTKIGQSVTFECHGAKWHLKKSTQSVYFLSAPLKTSRTRFGTRAEIRQDIEYVVEFGVFPPLTERMC